MGTESVSTPRRGRSLRLAAVLLAAGAVLTACESDGGSGETSASTLSPAPTTRPPLVQSQVVDLRVTGARNVTVRGATGTCRTPLGGLPKAFVITDPALGPGGYIFVFAKTTVPGRLSVPQNVKVLIGGLGMLSPTSGAGVQIAPDQQSVTLDAELSGTNGGSRSQAAVTTVLFKARITGTIRCT